MYHLSLNKMWYFDVTRISQKSIFKSKSESSLHHSSFQIKVFHHQEWIHFTAMFATPQYNGWMVSLLIFPSLCCNLLSWCSSSTGSGLLASAKLGKKIL